MSSPITVEEQEIVASPEEAEFIGRASARVGFLASGVLIAVLALLLVVPDLDRPVIDMGWWVLPLVLVGFVISEPLVFHIESKNEAVSFSPSDIPLAVALLALPPMGLIVARLVGSAVALLIFRRQPLFKFTLNLSSFMAEAMVAVIVFRLLTSLEPEITPITWLTLILALAAGLVTGAVVIATAISFFEGDFKARVAKEFNYLYLFHMPGAVLGASAAIPVPIAPWLGAVFLVPAPMVWLVLRSHGSLMHRFTDLSHIHEFSSEVGRSTDVDEIADIAVREIAGNLRAGTVAMVVWDDRGRTIEAVHGDPDLLARMPADPDEAAWALTTPPGQPLVISAESQAGRGGASERALVWLKSTGADEALLVSLYDGERPIGILAAIDRHGASDTFSADDVARLRPITRQLAVALRKGQLHLQIQYEATHDRLTGIANRAFFEAWVSQALVDEPAGRHALLLIDLDRFKEVNDTLGHHAGDALLVHVTQRMAECLKNDELASRLGGDEFAVYIPSGGVNEARAVAEAISEVLEQPFALGEATVAIASSIGIAVSPEHGHSTETLMHRADLAMYHAKRNHTRAQVFSTELEGQDTERFELLADLRGALRKGELDVHFQPQIEMKTSEVRSVEALARWTHPSRGVVPPDQFIGVAEQAGLIGELTDQVLTLSLGAARHWLDHGKRIGVAVNLSALSLVNEGMADTVAAALERSQVPPELLTLEITESTMIGDTPRTRKILEDLSELGVSLSVDDFGTGFSSLVSLRHLPFSELKIDRSFVTRMLIEPNDEVIVKSTVALGHALGMRIVAEGVETPLARDVLADVGCDLAQGYEICRPLPLHELDRWLEVGYQPSPVDPEAAARS